LENKLELAISLLGTPAFDWNIPDELHVSHPNVFPPNFYAQIFPLIIEVCYLSYTDGYEDNRGKDEDLY